MALTAVCIDHDGFKRWLLRACQAAEPLSAAHCVPSQIDSEQMAGRLISESRSATVTRDQVCEMLHLDGGLELDQGLSIGQGYKFLNRTRLQESR